MANIMPIQLGVSDEALTASDWGKSSFVLSAVPLSEIHPLIMYTILAGMHKLQCRNSYIVLKVFIIRLSLKCLLNRPNFNNVQY